MGKKMKRYFFVLLSIFVVSVLLIGSANALVIDVLDATGYNDTLNFATVTLVGSNKDGAIISEAHDIKTDGNLFERNYRIEIDPPPEVDITHVVFHLTTTVRWGFLDCYLQMHDGILVINGNPSFIYVSLDTEYRFFDPDNTVIKVDVKGGPEGEEISSVGSLTICGQNKFPHTGDGAIIRGRLDMQHDNWG
jgi:hypothetical protein